MTLFEKVNELLNYGYSVEFYTEWFNFHIVVRKRDLVDGKVIKDESCMPLQDHFTEEKVTNCIDYQVERIKKEIESLNP